MNIFRNPLGAATLATVVAGQALPYDPTRILLAENASTAYVFQPAPGDSGRSQLLSIDLSKTISTSQSPLTPLTDSLPFLPADGQAPYTPIIDSSGNITAITGDCSQGAQGSQVWRFTPDEDDDAGNGTWLQYQTSVQELGNDEPLAGANYLSAGMAFSEYTNGNMSDTSVYLFGGMCPFGDSSSSDWTSSANYSNLMVTLSAQQPNVGYSDYDISLAPGRGPPIAEAGFTITGLPPTYSANSAGGSQSQQQDFVLLGGHTKSAFINMSQVALFSLPQESWTFLPVTQPAGSGSGKVRRQASSQVEPRSGHTAVLSDDGSSIVVFGGWVGDVDTPAQPQLAILELGAGYGGTGSWSWSIPSETTSGGLPTGAGLYGHGATMLPGGVMMVVGGRSIAAPASARFRRDTSSNVMLYNVSSNSWITTYAAPNTAFSSQQQKSTGPLAKASQRAGLGLGLAIGIVLLVFLILFYFWYSKKLKTQREARTRALLASSSDGSFGQPFLENGSADGRGGEISAIGDYWQRPDRPVGEQFPWAQQQQQQMQQSGSATGLFMNVPSPTRGLRKGVGNRNYQYHAAPRYDENRASRGSGNIHPIAEHKDEDALERVPTIRDDMTLSEAQRQLQEVERILASNPKNVRDPFRDPEPNPLGSHPVSPETGGTVRRVPTGASRGYSPPRWQLPAANDNVPNWTTEDSVHEPLLYDRSGNASPTKTDERTSSTLSERSTKSNNSITRTMSTRTGALLAAAAAASSARGYQNLDNSSSSEDRTSTMSTNGGRKSPFNVVNRTRSTTVDSVPLSASTDADSFKTAKTNFLTLQTEGEILLGGRPPMDRDDPYQRAMAAHSGPTSTSAGPAPPMHEPSFIGLPNFQNRKRQGLMGSLRRALGAISTGERSFSLTGNRDSYLTTTNEEHSSSSSPTKDRRYQMPRRAASDGGALLKQKRGKKDWDSGNAWPPYRDDPDPGDWGEPRTSSDERQAGEDWDVEDAVQRRDIQVMFTVPKSRLRVVNDDMDRASLRSASEGAVSRSGSMRTVRSKESSKALRAKSEGDRALLAATAEEGESEGEEPLVGSGLGRNGKGKEKAY